MQRYSYKLLKFSDIDGPYRGVARAEEELEQQVNQQLNLLTVSGWSVQHFSVHYVGGRVVYTFLLRCLVREEPTVPPVEATERPGQQAEDATRRLMDITPSPLVSFSRRVLDNTTQLHLPVQGPTVGEEANKIRRTIETSKGSDYFRRALASFDASLKARGEQEKTATQTIALRALKLRDQKNEVTFQFALCWLSENGFSDRLLSSLLSASEPLIAETNIAKNVASATQNVQQVMLDGMSARFDLPEHPEPGQSRFQPRFGR
ncbi:MAG: hypothetical protein HXX20_10770 [Chloroflexi bacterium]|nr:hypothetical protein [Chloroflexota bacterium]